MTVKHSFRLIKKLILFLALLTSCSPQSSLQPEKDKKSQNPGQQQTLSIDEQIKEEDNSQEKQPSSAIVGQWECEELGDVLSFYGYNLPARLIFDSDGSYTWEIVKNGVKVISGGNYRLEERKDKPDRIFLSQSKEQDLTGKPFGERQKKEFQGIFEIKGKKLRTVFYDREFIPEVDDFQALDTQSYRKRK